MKKYCINCGKVIKNKKVKPLDDNNLNTFNADTSSDATNIEEAHQEDYCHHCHTANDFDSLAKMDSHEFNQLAHNNIIKSSDKKDNSLCFLVIGIILAIIGAILLVLSFKKNVRGVRVFRPESFEFMLCIALLTLGVLAILYAIFRLVKAQKTKKYFRSILRDVDYKD